MAIPKRTAERIKGAVKRFRKVLERARAADQSEQDTVTIVTDMLDEVFGFDKYTELTHEYAIRGSYCDLAVKIGGKVRYLIEVKSADKSLKDAHLRQATDYAAKEGIEWVVLTNGVEWQAYRMIFEQPIHYDHVFTMDLLEGGPAPVEKAYMLSREGMSKQAISEYHEQRQALDRYVLSAVLLSEAVLNKVRRELRRVAGGVKIGVADVKQVLTSEVLKRDVVENKRLKEAARRTRRSAARKRAERRRPTPASPKSALAASTEPVTQPPVLRPARPNATP